MERIFSEKRGSSLKIILLFLAMNLFVPVFFLIGEKPLWAADKKELIVYTVGGSWQQATDEFIGKPFSEKYGVKVTYDIRPNTEQVMALQASKNNPLADVIELSHSRLARAVSMGLLAEQDETKIPNRKFVPAKFKSDFYTGRGLTPIILVYNKEKVDDKDCTSWDVLANPKYKNKVAIMKYGWNGEQFLHAVNKVKGGSYDDPAPGLNFCRKVIENGGRVIDSNDHAMRLFESGEIWIAPFYPGRAEELIAKRVPLKYKFVPGSLSYLWGFSVVKNAKNMDLAYNWVDMTLDPNVQIKYAIKFNYAPTNSKVELPPEASKAKYSKEDLDKIIDLDIFEIAKTGDKILERFNIEVLKR